MKNLESIVTVKKFGVVAKAAGLIFAALVVSAFLNTVKADMLSGNDAPEVEVASDSAKVYEVVDVMPEIKGGLNKVYEFIEYPRLASRSGIEGRVFVKFIVTEDGKVKSPEILKDIGGGCGDAAIEGIKELEFIPGKKGGKAVSVYYTLPVNFKLSK